MSSSSGDVRMPRGPSRLRGGVIAESLLTLVGRALPGLLPDEDLLLGRTPADMGRAAINGGLPEPGRWRMSDATPDAAVAGRDPAADALSGR